MRRLFAMCLIGLATLAGCASSGGSSEEMSMDGSKPVAVVVTNTHGQVAVYTLETGKPVAHTAGGEKCAACESDIMAMLAGSKMSKTCPVCGASRELILSKGSGG